MTFRADRHVHILIIGGGAVGTALAYQLARAGAKDLLLVEKDRLTHGCTWHAAGLVGQLRGKKNLTRLMQNSVAVFDRLEAETGQAISWKKVGSLRLAASPARWSEIRRSMGQARSFGVECHALSAAEAKQRFPYIETAGIEGAAFIPGDGYIDPYSLTMAYAKGARQQGARIEEGVCVEQIALEGRRAVGVLTGAGRIACDILVNCAGLWAKRVGRLAGVELATSVVEHQYFLTEKKLDLAPDLTTLRDPDKNFYLKPDTGAFAIGGWEDGNARISSRHAAVVVRARTAAGQPGTPRTVCPSRRPATASTQRDGIQIVSTDRYRCRPRRTAHGSGPGLDNFYVACGFTAGIAASGGAGLALSNLIVHGDAGMDLWPFDVRRFSAPQAQPRYLEKRAIEAYGAYYKIHWPLEEPHSARNLRRSPVHERLAALPARCLAPKPVGSGRTGLRLPGVECAGSAQLRAEAQLVRARGQASGRPSGSAPRSIDQTSFAKFELVG